MGEKHEEGKVIELLIEFDGKLIINSTQRNFMLSSLRQIILGWNFKNFIKFAWKWGFNLWLKNSW